MRKRTSTSASKAKIKLICFPPAGAGASIFESWQTKFSPDIDMILVQYPGREDRREESLVTSMPELVQDLTKRIESELQTPYVYFGDTKLDCPYAFFGHGLGALIGFEVARELRRLGFPTPRCFLASSFYSPMIFSLLTRQGLSRPLDESELTDRLFQGSQPWATLSKDAGGDQERELERESYLKILEADIKLCIGYEYSSELPLSCPITCFYSTEDSMIKDPALVRHWGMEASQIFRIREFKGDHCYWRNQQDVFLQVIFQELTLYLNFLDRLFIKSLKILTQF